MTVLFGAYGCLPSEIVMLTNPPQSSSCRDTIEFDSPKPEFAKTIKEVGKELGLKDQSRSMYAGLTGASMQMYQAQNPNHISVSLLSGTGLGSHLNMTLGTGSMKMVQLIAVSIDNGQKWTFSVSVTGNFSAGKEDAAQKAWDEFKGKLMARIPKVANR